MRNSSFPAARILGAAAFAVALLSGGLEGQTFTEYPLPWAGTPAAVSGGADGGLWFTDPGANAIGRLSRTGMFRKIEIPTPAAQPRSIVGADDGAMWFTEQAGNKLGRISPGGVLTEFPIPTPASAPQGIALALHGDVWFVESADGANKIGRLTPPGLFVEFPLPTAAARPDSIVLGPDGAFWFTENGAGKIGRITEDGTITEFPLPNPAAAPQGIIVGWDSNLWFVEFQAGLIGRMTPQGVLTEFPIFTGLTVHPEAITKSAYGDMWFTAGSLNVVGRVTDDGAVSLLEPPTWSSHPGGISGGPDSAIWFTQKGGFGRLSRIFELDSTNLGHYGVAAAPGGVIWYTAPETNSVSRLTRGGQLQSHWVLPTPGARPEGIAASPDGNAWFTEYQGNKIGRVTPEGAITEFPIPTADSGPYAITLGPDGNMWFTESLKDKIGRITPQGVITEFPVPTANAGVQGITAGGDGNLWFTESGASQIGRMTPQGSVVEFDTPGTNTLPWGIALGADGNVWFTEVATSKIGRMTPTGDGEEFSIALNAAAFWITPGPDGNLWFTEFVGDRIGRITTAGKVREIRLPTPVAGAQGIAVGTDGKIYFAESSLDRLGIVDLPGTKMAPSSGPAGGGTPARILAWGLEYGPPTALFSGVAATGISVVTDSDTELDLVTPSLPPGALHDVEIVREDGSSLFAPRLWMTDFLDVPPSDGFHDFVETIFRRGVTAGCGAGRYCGSADVTRAQMAVFLVKAQFGSEFEPGPCQGVFPDVPCASPYAPWIEELDLFGITSGCGGGNYCPGAPVTRAQMAVFLLKMRYGQGHVPPPCEGAFADVACPGGFAVDWIEELAALGITGGCGSGLYCPTRPVTRGQMAVFLARAFRM